MLDDFQIISVSTAVSIQKKTSGRITPVQSSSPLCVKMCVLCLQDLVSEKLNVQQKNVELEKLNEELEKIGLNTEKLLQEEHLQDDRWVQSAVYRKSYT